MPWWKNMYQFSKRPKNVQETWSFYLICEYIVPNTRKTLLHFVLSEALPLEILDPAVGSDHILAECLEIIPGIGPVHTWRSHLYLEDPFTHGDHYTCMEDLFTHGGPVNRCKFHLHMGMDFTCRGPPVYMWRLIMFTCGGTDLSMYGEPVHTMEVPFTHGGPDHMWKSQHRWSSCSHM